VLIGSERNAESVLREFVCDYNEGRLHRGIDLKPPVPYLTLHDFGSGNLSSALTVSAAGCTSTGSPPDPRLAPPIAWDIPAIS